MPANRTTSSVRHGAGTRSYHRHRCITPHFQWLRVLVKIRAPTTARTAATTTAPLTTTLAAFSPPASAPWRHGRPLSAQAGPRPKQPEWRGAHEWMRTFTGPARCQTPLVPWTGGRCPPHTLKRHRSWEPAPAGRHRWLGPSGRDPGPAFSALYSVCVQGLCCPPRPCARGSPHGRAGRGNAIAVAATPRGGRVSLEPQRHQGAAPSPSPHPMYV